MSREPIAFVGRHPDAPARWLGHVQDAMADERVVDLAALSDMEREAVRLAIVADPDPQDLARLPSLEWVHGLWAGVERLVAELPRELPIVRLVDPLMADTMSEAVLCAVLWLHRQGPNYDRQQRKAVWHQREYSRAEDRRVTVMGLGHLGRACAERLARNGFAVSGWSRSAKDIAGVTTFHATPGLEAALVDADIVVSLLPATPETRGFFDAATLRRLKPGAALINFGRGSAVDETALLAALESGHLSHAFLDVFSAEPLPPAHPFWEHDDVTIWPHVSAPTDKQTAAAIVAENVASWRATGQLPPTVDRSRGY